MARFPERYLLPDRIETRRLVLRAPMRGDVPALVRLADNIRISSMLARLPHPFTRADAIGFVEILSQRHDHRAYALGLGDEGLIGVVSLSYFEGVPPELGYWLGEPFWRRGLMSEAVAGLLDAAFATGAYPVIEARTLAENTASAGLLDKLGFARLSTSVDTEGPSAGKRMTRFRLEQPL